MFLFLLQVEVFEALSAKELTDVVRRTLEEANTPPDRIQDGIGREKMADIVSSQ
jgi:hypothetical protein